MSSIDFVEKARDWSTLLEKREADRSGRNIADARSDAARRAGVRESIFVSLRKRRLKGIDVSDYFNLGAAVQRELQLEMRRHEHELQMLRQAGVDPRDSQVAEAEAGLAAVRSALGIGD